MQQWGGTAINLVQKARPEVLATGGGERGSRSPLAADSPGSVRRRGVLGAPLRTPFATASYWAHREKRKPSISLVLWEKKKGNVKEEIQRTEAKGETRPVLSVPAPTGSAVREGTRKAPGLLPSAWDLGQAAHSLDLVS